MLPKEHGAYGQLAFPVCTALVATGLSGSSLLTALACVALFLSHEPLLVLLGHRGTRAQALDTNRAGWWLIATLAFATAAGLLAIDATTADLRWTFLVPAIPGVLVLVAVVQGREKTLSGETAVALTFAAAALPIGAGSGHVAAGLTIGVVFGLLFVLSTLAVRAIVLRTRKGGDAQAAGRTRSAAFGIAILAALVALVAATDGVVSWMIVAALLPGVAFTSVLAGFPPPAARLKRVGWSLVAVTAMTAVLLVAAI